MIRIALADDHNMVRQGLRALLAAEKDFSVVGEAKDGLEALDLVERTAPEVLVLDVTMPGLNGLEVARRVARGFPKTRIIMLSVDSSERCLIEALRNGACSFVVKDAAFAELAHAVREGVRGRRYLSPPFSREGVDQYLKEVKAPPGDRYEKLTTREREVFELAAAGLSSSELGRRLFISPRTVEDHRSSVLRKLGLKSQTELVRYAIRRGIVRLDP